MSSWCGSTCRRGRRWLDVGCGTGALTDAILKRSAPGIVIGIDPVQPFIERASATLLDPRASFRLGSAIETGLPDDGVDVVVAGFVLNFVPDVGAALAEWRRVLARGGVVGAYVWDYARGMALIRLFWDAAVAVDPGAAALDQGGQAGITDAGLEAAFQEAGFVAVEAGVDHDPDGVRGLRRPVAPLPWRHRWGPGLSGDAGRRPSRRDPRTAPPIHHRRAGRLDPPRSARLDGPSPPARLSAARGLDPSARSRGWVVATEQDPEVCLPRADVRIVRAGHRREDLRDVIQVVDRPRGEKLAERDLAEGGMDAPPVEV